MYIQVAQAEMITYREMTVNLNIRTVLKNCTGYKRLLHLLCLPLGVIHNMKISSYRLLSCSV